MDNFWILCLAAGTLLIRVGLAMIANRSGLRRANLNTLIEIATCTIVFSLVAPMMLSGPVAFAQGVISGEIPAQQWMGSTERVAYLSMLLVGSGLISIVLAEDRADRVILSTVYYVLASVVIGNLIWYGPLALWGIRDLGGVGTIFLTSGVMSALLTYRKRAAATVQETNPSREINASDHQLAGWLLMLVGLVPFAMLSGFLHESYRDGCVENVLLASSTGVLAAVLFCTIRRKPDAAAIAPAAMLTGAVASLSVGGMVNAMGSALIGFAGGLFVPILLELANPLRERRMHGLLAVYIIGGAWGLKSVAFVMPVEEGSRTSIFGIQATGALAAAVAGAIAGALMLVYCAFTARRSHP